LDQVFFVHERAGKLARLTMGDAAARHSETPAKLFGPPPGIGRGAGIFPKGLILSGSSLDSSYRFFEPIDGSSTGPLCPVRTSHENAIGFWDARYSFAGNALGFTDFSGHVSFLFG
jgi:hypothetical protein